MMRGTFQPIFGHFPRFSENNAASVKMMMIAIAEGEIPVYFLS